MELIKKQITRIVTTATTTCDDGIVGNCYKIIPDESVSYNLKLLLTSKNIDFGFFDALIQDEYIEPITTTTTTAAPDPTPEPIPPTEPEPTPEPEPIVLVEVKLRVNLNGIIQDIDEFLYELELIPNTTNPANSSFLTVPMTVSDSNTSKSLSKLIIKVTDTFTVIIRRKDIDNFGLFASNFDATIAFNGSSNIVIPSDILQREGTLIQLPYDISLNSGVDGHKINIVIDEDPLAGTQVDDTIRVDPSDPDSGGPIQGT